MTTDKKLQQAAEEKFPIDRTTDLTPNALMSEVMSANSANYYRQEGFIVGAEWQSQQPTVEQPKESQSAIEKYTYAKYTQSREGQPTADFVWTEELVLECAARSHTPKYEVTIEEFKKSKQEQPTVELLSEIERSIIDEGEKWEEIAKDKIYTILSNYDRESFGSRTNRVVHWFRNNLPPSVTNSEDSINSGEQCKLKSTVNNGEKGEWQLCPKCHGDGHLGRHNSPPMSTTATPMCDVCYGNKIIARPVSNPTFTDQQIEEMAEKEYPEKPTVDFNIHSRKAWIKGFKAALNYGK